jgi:hypothetical protein
MSFTFSFLAILLVMNSPITASSFEIRGGNTHVYKYRRHTDMTYHSPLSNPAKKPQAMAKAPAKPKVSLETNRLVDIIDKIMGEL